MILKGWLQATETKKVEMETVLGLLVESRPLLRERDITGKRT